MTQPIVKGPNWRHGNFRGGKSKSGNGYVYIEASNHPRADTRGRLYEHIAVVEAALGHILSEGANVHHINEVRNDNRNSNLVACQDYAYHRLLHSRARAYYATGNVHSITCCYCSKWVLPNDPEYRAFDVHGNGCKRGWHYSCRSAYDKQRWANKRGTA